ncbi:hypothetical protein OROHE_019482 [Orobanche hederae]
MLEVVEAKNGKEAIDIYTSGTKSYDVILMDLEMPVINGEKATAELQRLGAKSLIVGVINCQSEEEKEAFKKAGLDYCFEKPLTMNKYMEDNEVSAAPYAATDIMYLVGKLEEVQVVFVYREANQYVAALSKYGCFQLQSHNSQLLFYK